ncbi:hypothetical protein SAMN04489723_12925 [Algoriphagus aquimarinus]|uniref:Uncharacterized protein n=1 Tax=Algoriphagus aquimarinus TaxID=237018 RepID=A0A1I1CDI5_9BACT|nr:hypothetical protein SAMN04489723_12925 [Algoriphagus aquimarinus]
MLIFLSNGLINSILLVIKSMYEWSGYIGFSKKYSLNLQGIFSRIPIRICSFFDRVTIPGMIIYGEFAHQFP